MMPVDSYGRTVLAYHRAKADEVAAEQALAAATVTRTAAEADMREAAKALECSVAVDSAGKDTAKAGPKATPAYAGQVIYAGGKAYVAKDDIKQPTPGILAWYEVAPSTDDTSKEKW